MLNYEQKILLSLCRNNEDYKYILKFINIDYDLLMKYSIDHRIFLNIYDKLFAIIPESLKIGYCIFYDSIIKSKQFYDEFFIHVISLLNKNNFDYVVLKGLATEFQIYNNNFTRMYSDLDLLVYEEDFTKVINYICSSFSLGEMDNIGDYYRHEVKIKVFWNGQEYTIEIKRRHRECDFNTTRFFLENKKNISFNNIDFPVLTKDALFISLSLYLYNYSERVYSWIFSKKIRLCYYFDLYSFMINNEINYDKVINICYEKNILYKIAIVLNNLSNLFSDSSIKDISNRFLYKNAKNIHNDIDGKGRINWNIGIIDRVFNYSSVANIIQSMCSGQFLIGNANKNIYKNQVLSLFDKNKKIFDISKIDIFENKLKIFFSNVNISYDGSSLIFIKLYLYNQYGEFSFPYIPISIRFDSNKIFAYNRFTVDASNFTYKYENEKLMPYQNIDMIGIEKSTDEIKVSIDLKFLDYDRNVSNRIGFSVEFIKILNGCTYVVDRTNDDDFPYIIEMLY